MSAADVLGGTQGETKPSLPSSATMRSKAICVLRLPELAMVVV